MDNPPIYFSWIDSDNTVDNTPIYFIWTDFDSTVDNPPIYFIWTNFDSIVDNPPVFFFSFFFSLDTLRKYFFKQTLIKCLLDNHLIKTVYSCYAFTLDMRDVPMHVRFTKKPTA